MPAKSPIAIVGMACRLPGARDLSEYWRLLIEGRSSLGPMPESRLDRRLHFDPEGRDRPGGPRMGTTYTDLAGVIEPSPEDAYTDLLPEDLAAACDPTHVTFCRVAAEAVRSAGWDPRRMPTRRGGVYVGHTRGTVVAGQLIYGTLAGRAAEWLRECPTAAADELGGSEGLEGLIAGVVDSVRAEMPARAADGSPQLDAHYVASLASRALGFEGPAMAVNAACASSLIAMAMGVNALEQDKVDCVVVGGASHCKLDSLVLFSKAQSASATGSRPFDDSADGLVAAEGYVALVLKKLDRAVADGDPIWAVVRGVGVSSDGKGKSLWAPRQEGQVEAIRRAYPEGLGPDAIDYIEAHATSTQVGDATELGALDAVFAPHRAGRGKLPIGTAKGNVGHTLETAGMAGLVKAVLAMRAGVIPPAVNLEKLNQKIDWPSLALEVAREPTPWPETARGNKPRCAAVNAFGIGGLNAHVVLQDRVDEALLNQPPTPEAARPASRSEDRRIAVVGASVLAPGALSLEAYGELLGKAEGQFAALADTRWGLASAVDPRHRRPHHAASDRGAPLRNWRYDWKRHRVPPKQIAAADPLQFMLLDAVDAALLDAGLQQDGKPSERWDRRSAAVMIGSDFLGDFSADLQLAVRLPHLLDSIAQLLQMRGARREAIEQVLSEFEERFVKHNPALLDETGSFTTSTLASRISKTYDLMGGAAAVDAGDASAAALIDAAADWLLERRCDSLVCAAGQRALGLFNFERLSLLGRLRGPDGRGFVEPGEGAGVVVLKRLTDAQADGDRVRAVIDPLGVDRAEEPGVASRVSQIVGHWGGASGMAELLARVTRPPEQDDTLRVHGGGGQRYTLRVSPPADRVPPAVCRADEPAAPPRRDAAREEVRVVRMSGATERELLDRCRSWAERLCRSEERVAAWSEVVASGFDPRHAERLAFATGSPVEAAKKLRLVAKAEDTSPAALAAKGVLRRRADASPQVVAWCFAGQGSQYGGMLQSFIEGNAYTEQQIEQIGQAFVDLGMPRWTTIAWHEADQLGSDVLRTKLAVLGADWLLADQLRQRGLAPTFVCGHSFGEYAALAQAGVWRWADAARAAVVRAGAVVEHGADGAMLCTDADASTTSRLCEQVRGETGLGVYLANHNAPRQCVIGGEPHSIAEVANRLKAEGFRVAPIPVPRPYHTPLLDRTRGPLETDLRGIAMRPAATPVLSSVSNCYEADPVQIRENLVQQMITPVRYVELIERLKADGVGLLVEVGPGKVLTKLHQAILGGGGPLVVSTDDKQLGTRVALDLVEAAYEMLAPLPEVSAPTARRPAAPTGEDAAVAPVDHALSTADTGHALEVADADRSLFTLMELGGTPREIGYEHGRLCRDALRAAAQQIADAAGGQHLPPLGELADDPQALFGPDDWEELIGLSEGSGVALSTVAACNLYAYPDLSGLGGCCQLAAPDAGGAGRVHAANEDLPLSLIVPELRRRVVQWCRPSEGQPHVTFSAAGQLGGIAGMNAAGLSISSAMLLDRPRPVGAPAGLLHGVLVRHTLRWATSKEEALALFENPPQGRRGAGGWAVILSDGNSQESILVEYDAGEMLVQRGERLLAANHAQLLTPSEPVPKHSLHREERLRWIADPADPVASAKAILRDRHDGRLGRTARHRTMNTVCRLDNQLSVVMRPAKRELWVHASAKDTDGGYVKLRIRDAAQPAGPPDVTVGKSLRSQSPLPPSGTPEDLSAQQYAESIHSYEAPSERVCDRFAVRLVESEAIAESSAEVPPPAGLVVGDESLTAAMVDKCGVGWRGVAWESLVENGLRSLEAGPLGVVIAPQEATDADRLAEWFDAVQKLVASADRRGITDRLRLVFVSRLGGRYGWHGLTEHCTADPLAGLAKGIGMEYGVGGQAAPRVFALDASPGEDVRALAAAVDSLLQQSAGASVEWAMPAGPDRMLQTRIVPASLECVARGPSADDGGCWVVTGGGRGVTALAAERLARERRVTVHLIGSTELEIEPRWLELDEAGLDELKRQTLKRAIEAGVRPPLKAWTRVERMLEAAGNLQRMRSQGLDVHYHACDLRDALAVRQTLDQIRGHGKPVVGVIHGAGYEKSCRFSRKKPDDVHRTLAVKLSGLDALASALADDPLKWFLCFGSTAGRFGSVGQTDYALANDAMARRMARLRAERPGCRWACFHWTAWGDVGMAMRGEVLATLKERGIALMPAAEGVDHLLAEIASDATDTEVVITDAGRFKQLVGGDPLLARTEAAPTPAGATRRYTLRMQDRPTRAGRPAPPSRRALLWGDPDWCGALAEGLQGRGADCLVLGDDLPTEQADAAIQRHAEAGAIDRVILVPPAEGDGPTAAATRMIQCVQSWVRAAKQSGHAADALRVATVTRLGGDHGLGGHTAPAAGGAGVVKSLVVELHERGYKGVGCVAIDLAESAPQRAVVERVLEEIDQAGSGDLEIGVPAADAPARRLVYHQSPAVSANAEAKSAPSGDWLVTGGARGVTCEAAIGVAQRYGLRLHLLGSSDLGLLPADWATLGDAGRAELKKRVLAEAACSGRKEPPLRAWERLERAGEVAVNLERYRAAGVEAHYYCCDLTDPSTLRATLAQVTSTAGAISGLMHGAGYEKSADLLKKRPADIDRTLRIKLDAFDALLAVLPRETLRHVIAFGSISGRLGGLGQIDYCYANDALAKRVHRILAESPHVLATTFDWHSWDGVGMAVRPETQRIKAKLGMTHMSIAEGVGRLIEELELGLPEGQVLVTTPAHLCRMGQQSIDGQEITDAVTTPRPPLSETPLLTRAADAGAAAGSGTHCYAMPLDPVGDPFLAQHRFKDRPLLPLVIGVEAMLQACGLAEAAIGERQTAGAWELSGIEVDGPLRLPSDQPQEAKVALVASGDAWQAELTSRFRNARGRVSPKARRHFTARVGRVASADPQRVALPTDDEVAGLRDVAIRDDLVLYHGPVFRMVEQISINGASAVATIRVPAPADLVAEGRPAEGWVTSPAVVDACLFACGIHLYVTDRGAVSAPMGVERLTVLTPCREGERLWLRLVNRTTPNSGQRDGASKLDEARFDFVLHDDRGEPRLRVEGYRATIVVRSALVASAGAGDEARGE